MWACWCPLLRKLYLYDGQMSVQSPGSLLDRVLHLRLFAFPKFLGLKTNRWVRDVQLLTTTVGLWICLQRCSREVAAGTWRISHRGLNEHLATLLPIALDRTSAAISWTDPRCCFSHTSPHYCPSLSNSLSASRRRRRPRRRCGRRRRRRRRVIITLIISNHCFYPHPSP